jgi:hypothetical protein
VWLAGLDLGFPGRKTHFKGARFEEKALSESSRLNPTETASFHALRGGGLFFAKDAAGRPLLTDKRLSLYGSWLSSALAGVNTPIARLGDAGLAISNIKTASSEALLALPPLTQGALSAVVDSILAEFAADQPARTRKYAASIVTLREKLTTALAEKDDQALVSLLFPEKVQTSALVEETRRIARAVVERLF